MHALIASSAAAASGADQREEEERGRDERERETGNRVLATDRGERESVRVRDDEPHMSRGSSRILPPSLLIS